MSQSRDARSLAVWRHFVAVLLHLLRHTALRVPPLVSRSVLRLCPYATRTSPPDCSHCAYRCLQLSGIVASWTAALLAFLWQCACIWLQPEVPALPHQLEPCNLAQKASLSTHRCHDLWHCTGWVSSNASSQHVASWTQPCRLLVTVCLHRAATKSAGTAAPNRTVKCVTAGITVGPSPVALYEVDVVRREQP